MELYEQIRREYEFGAGTIIGIARKLGVHRRMVREAVRSATPARRKKTERPQVKMAAVSGFIDAILEGDRKAPRKQRHTAKRIWERTREEVAGSTVAERTVRQYVERRKQELGYGRKDSRHGRARAGAGGRDRARDSSQIALSHVGGWTWTTTVLLSTRPC